MSKSEVIEFIREQGQEAVIAVKAREEMERVWAGGTDESWRAVGCFKTKAQRLKESQTHGRIAIKCRRRVELFKEAIRLLEESK